MKRPILNYLEGSAALTKARKIVSLGATLLAAAVGSANAATVTVTVVDDGVNLGVPGSFYWAITNCNAGDTIAFNITGHGSGPFYFQVPAYGFPLIYHKDNLTIDGYTQPSASPNTNPITNANNAVIKIVIDGRGGGSRNMQYEKYDGTIATSDPPIDNTAQASEGSGWGENEQGLLGIYRSKNVNLRGLAFLGTVFNDLQGLGGSTGNQKGVCIAQDFGGDTNVCGSQWSYTNGISSGCHINGCWFGVDPTNSTVTGVAYYRTCITSWSHGANNGRPEIDCQDLIVGVAPGSANPRAEFNVIVGSGAGIDADVVRMRVSGNYLGVLPDGVTAFNPIELGTYWRGDGYIAPESGIIDTQPIIIGTDGDGVNDADEGNLFGPLGSPGNSTEPELSISAGGHPWIIAGNRFGLGNNNTRWTNNNFRVMNCSINNLGCQVRFGSDFNGVSDALEANIVYNNNTFASFYPSPAGYVSDSLFRAMNKAPALVSGQMDAWISVRGNVMVNCFPIYNPDDPSSGSQYAAYWANVVVDDTGSTLTVPSLDSSSTTTTLKGTFCAPTNSCLFTNAVVVDLYVADPEGISNGALFDQPFFGSAGYPQGKTSLASYLVPNPRAGVFTFDISHLGLASGTKVTAAVTYSSFARPDITSISRQGGSTRLTWTGDNGGPFLTAGHGGATSGFGVQRAPSLNGPWTTTYAANNSVTLADSSGSSFYRIVGPVSGMTTLFAPAITLP